MLPVKKSNMLVQAQMDQKEYITYGTLKLIIPFRSQYQDNLKKVNPVIATVVGIRDQKYIKKGDMVILSHNSLINKAWHIQDEGQSAFVSIPLDRWVLGKIDDEGQIQPLNGNCIAQRIDEPPASSIIIIPETAKKTEKNRVKIVQVSPGETRIPVECDAIIFDYADNEVYWNWKGDERSAVVVYRDDIVALLAGKPESHTHTQ